jgi:hypothetical protein
MRKKGSIYKYIAVYIDDLAIVMKNPKEFTEILENKHKFKLKGTGPITFTSVWISQGMMTTHYVFHLQNT